MEPEPAEPNRIVPEMGCTGTNDVVLAPMEPSLESAASTAVESVSWGQIKAAY